MPLGRKATEEIIFPPGQFLASGPITSPDPAIAYPLGKINNIQAPLISASSAKVSFVIPDDIRTFTILLVLSSCPSTTNTEYRTSSTYLLSYVTELNTAAVEDTLWWSLLLDAGGDSPSGYPTISSAHFGTDNTGSDKRTHTTGGEFSIVFDATTTSSYISLEVLHINP